MRPSPQDFAKVARVIYNRCGQHRTLEFDSTVNYPLDRREVSFALSYTHLISSGGGLVGAVKLDSATASVRQLITKTLSASLTGGYTQNNVIGNPLLGPTNGHTISGTASLQQQLGARIPGVQLGYTRLRQDYSNIAVISATPNTNREFVSISYQFSRPLGR